MLGRDSKLIHPFALQCLEWFMTPGCPLSVVAGMVVRVHWVYISELWPGWFPKGREWEQERAIPQGRFISRSFISTDVLCLLVSFVNWIKFLLFQGTWLFQGTLLATYLFGKMKIFCNVNNRFLIYMWSKLRFLYVRFFFFKRWVQWSIFAISKNIFTVIEWEIDWI